MKSTRDIELTMACAKLAQAINRESAVKRANDVYYSTRRPAYVDGVIIHDRKRRTV